MPTGVVLMTAMPPTKGHGALIEFAARFMNEQYNGGRFPPYLTVIVSSRDFEPLSGKSRLAAIKNFSRKIEKSYDFFTDISIVSHADDNAPQNPSESNSEEEFWNYWRGVVKQRTGMLPIDFVFASEEYGVDLAKALNAKFIPFNMNRSIYNTKATECRNSWDNFGDILPEYQRILKKTVTFFGAESCGKTTMAKAMADAFNGIFVPEWAREHLELNGIEVTVDKMREIAFGQKSLQETAFFNVQDKAIVFQDTDLLSTYGYCDLFSTSDEMKDVKKLCEKLMFPLSDLYIVMNDKIPFEVDPLRYGGDRRESSMWYWVDILKEFDCNYHVVRAVDRNEQVQEVIKVIEDFMDLTWKPLRDFKRT